MKAMGSLLKKALGIVTITMPLALSAAADMTMNNVEIQNCTAKGDQCITVKSPKAQVATMRPIYFMNQIEVKIGSPKGPQTTAQRSQGYLDFDSNQLVLQTIDKKGTLTEEVYNLTTMQKQVFVTR